MQKARFSGFAGIGGEDAVDVGPNDELIGVHNVSDDSAGKIGAVAAERGDVAAGSCADKAGDDGNYAGFEEQEKYVAAPLPRLLKSGLLLSVCVERPIVLCSSEGTG